MQICGGMQWKILEGFAKGMREIKGYTCTRYLRWKTSCHGTLELIEFIL